MRILVLKICFLLGVLAIVARLFYWQIYKSNYLKKIAENQRTGVQNVMAKRGNILASDGYPLATNKPAYFLAIDLDTLRKNPQDIEKIKKIDKNIATSLEDLRQKWTKIGPVEKTDLNFSGVTVEDNSIRFYPEASMSGHLTGFLGGDNDGFPKGYFGLEGYYDRELSGRSGKLIQEEDAFSRPILVGDRKIVPVQDGRDILTSIDRTVQFLIANKLKNGIEKYGAVGGSILVMDPATGQIIAMTSFPGYDPNKYGQYSTEIYKNPTVADTYEPGSTFKTLIMAAGLDAGVISPDSECDICSGPIKISEYSIKTWNDKYYPKTTMTDVIAHSDNTGMVFVQRKLGGKKMLEYLNKFGIGSSTDIDLEEEAFLPLRKLSDWREVDLATAAFGQGIAVTPIQILRAVGAIANRGVMVVPKIEKMENIGKTVRVISEKTASQVTAMMVNSVEKGDAKWARPVGLEIAGKTGTAQIAIDGHYDEKKTIASFVGFAPANKPKFVMLVLLSEPKTSQWGSETAAPLWFDIAKELSRYYRI